MKFANFLSLIRCKLKMRLNFCPGWVASPLMNLGRINLALNDIHNRDVTVVEFRFSISGIHHHILWLE